MLARTRQTLVLIFVVVSAAASAAADDASVVYADALLTEAESATFMGVHLEEEVDHPEGGARVSEVVRDSPADAAGIEDGDIVVRFDGHVIRGPVALTQKIHAREPGDVVEVVVIRDGRERKPRTRAGSASQQRSVLRVADRPGRRIDLRLHRLERRTVGRVAREVHRPDGTTR